MRVTFAHMGTSVIPFESLLDSLGHEVIRPRRPTEETLNLGARYAPEFACIPFKIVLGTYLEAMEDGVDTIISGGGMGPCRAGYYGELHRRILRDLGYEPEMMFFFPPLKAPLDFVSKLRHVKGKVSWLEFYRKFAVAWEQIKALDDLEIRSHEARAREAVRGATTRALRRGLALMASTRTRPEVQTARDKALALLDQVEQLPAGNENVLRIGVIGEIYVQLEPALNFHLEERLGEMGVHVRRSIFLTNFARTDVLGHGARDIKELARPYLSEKVGGHGQNSIGETILYAREGYDGVVQLAPFTCIPEIVAKSIMPRLSRDLDIPVLTLFIDEQTGPAGVETRLEAFVDLLRAKRRRQAG